MIVSDERLDSGSKMRFAERHDAGQTLGSAEGFAFHRETAALVVAETNPVRAVRSTEHAVLLQQVVNDVLLLAVDPARE